MRDINRIDKITNSLNTFWKQSPDLRLGQLLSSLKEQNNPGADIFYIEDTYWEEWLRNLGDNADEVSLKLQGFSEAYISEQITKKYRKNRLDYIIYNLEKEIEVSRKQGNYSIGHNFKVVNIEDQNFSNNDIILQSEIKSIVEYFSNKKYDVKISAEFAPTKLHDTNTITISWLNIKK